MIWRIIGGEESVIHSTNSFTIFPSFSRTFWRSFGWMRRRFWIKERDSYRTFPFGFFKHWVIFEIELGSLRITLALALFKSVFEEVINFLKILRVLHNGSFFCGFFALIPIYEKAIFSYLKNPLDVVRNDFENQKIDSQIAYIYVNNEHIYT